MGIEVTATQLGFYDNIRRREGDKFEVESEEEIGQWMKPTKPLSKKAAPVAPAKAAAKGGKVDKAAQLEAARLDLEAKVDASNELNAAAKKAREDLTIDASEEEIKEVEALEAQALAAYEVAVKAQEVYDSLAV